MNKQHKIGTIVAALVLSASLLLAGCGGNSSQNSSGSEEPGSSAASGALASGQLAAVHQAVKDAYGENYLPTMELDATVLEEIYGVDPALVQDFIAESPMISVHVDTFIGIEAVEGKGEEVEKALSDYRETLINDTMQYPMNMAKVQASTVLREGDYVFFVMLGAIDDSGETDEGKQLEFAQNEVQKGLDAIKSTLK